jgi:hypothetical protein
MIFSIHVLVLFWLIAQPPNTVALFDDCLEIFDNLAYLHQDQLGLMETIEYSVIKYHVSKVSWQLILQFKCIFINIKDEKILGSFLTNRRKFLTVIRRVIVVAGKYNDGKTILNDMQYFSNLPKELIITTDLLKDMKTVALCLNWRNSWMDILEHTNNESSIIIHKATETWEKGDIKVGCFHYPPFSLGKQIYLKLIFAKQGFYDWKKK